MRRWGSAALIALVLVWVASSLFVVDQSEFAVQLRFGNPVATHLEPGLKVKLPWPLDTVARFDNRLMVLENPGPGEPEKEYLTQDEASGIGKNVVVNTATCWRIRDDADSVRRFLETMGDQAAAEARIGDAVISELGALLGQNDFAVLVSVDPATRRWEDFLGTILARCAERMDAYGIEIVDVRIQRLNFPEQNRRNVFDRMRAERETIAARYRSEGEEEATIVRAQAERQRDEILAGAFEEAETIRGQADAEAARIYAEAYGEDAEFYSFVRTLDAYETAFQEGTVAVLSGDSEFLKLLNPSAGMLSPGQTPEEPQP